MNTVATRGLVIAIISAVPYAAVAHQSPPEVTTSICELARRGQEMSGKRVRVKVVFDTDCRHGSVAVDPQCPTVVMSVSYSHKEPKDKGLADFNRVVCALPSDWATNPRPSELIREYSLEASGEFVWRPREVRHLIIVERQGLLVIDKVWQFKRIPRLPG
jgi:hypothetical protein